MNDDDRKLTQELYESRARAQREQRWHDTYNAVMIGLCAHPSRTFVSTSLQLAETLAAESATRVHGPLVPDSEAP
jgi:hypothetical protein